MNQKDSQNEAGAERLANRAVTGSLLATSASFASTVIGLARSVVLIRLLAPADFGTFALASSFFGFLTFLRMWGFNMALIQKESPTHQDYAAHFVAHVLLSVFIFGCSFLSFPLLNLFYPGQSALSFLIVGLAFIDLLGSINHTPLAKLQRELKFEVVYRINVSCSVAATLLAIGLALAGAGIWSLLGIPLGGIVARALGVWVFNRPWKLSIQTNLERIRYFFAFGKPIFLSSSLQNILNRFDDFWIGTFVGTSALGFYNRAYEFSQYGSQIATNPLLSVFYPIFSRLKTDRDALSRAFLRCTGLIVRVGVLLSGYVFIAGEDLIRLLFGERWLPIQPVLEILMVFLVASSFVNASRSLLISLERHHVLTRISLLQILLFIPAVVLLFKYFGTTGVAVALDLSAVAGIVIVAPYVRKHVHLSVFRIVVVPSALMLLILLASTLVLPESQGISSVASVTIQLLVISSAYLFLIWLFERKMWRSTVQFVISRLRHGHREVDRTR